MKTIEEPVVIREGDSFKVVLSKYGALALDKQENLSELIGDAEGELFINTQVWALIAEICDEERIKVIKNTVEALKTEHGYLLL